MPNPPIEPINIPELDEKEIFELIHEFSFEILTKERITEGYRLLSVNLEEKELVEMCKALGMAFLFTAKEERPVINNLHGIHYFNIKK